VFFSWDQVLFTKWFLLPRLNLLFMSILRNVILCIYIQNELFSIPRTVFLPLAETWDTYVNYFCNKSWILWEDGIQPLTYLIISSFIIGIIKVVIFYYYNFFIKLFSFMILIINQFNELTWLIQFIFLIDFF